MSRGPNAASASRDRRPGDGPDLWTPRELAQYQRVDVKTVARWVKTGRIPERHVVRSPSGRVRFRAEGVAEMFRDGQS